VERRSVKILTSQRLARRSKLAAILVGTRSVSDRIPMSQRLGTCPGGSGYMTGIIIFSASNRRILL
jgi:hypothetical protein